MWGKTTEREVLRWNSNYSMTSDPPTYVFKRQNNVHGYPYKVWTTSTAWRIVYQNKQLVTLSIRRRWTKQYILLLYRRKRCQHLSNRTLCLYRPQSQSVQAAETETALFLLLPPISTVPLHFTFAQQPSETLDHEFHTMNLKEHHCLLFATVHQQASGNMARKSSRFPHASLLHSSKWLQVLVCIASVRIHFFFEPPWSLSKISCSDWTG
jgi:hypothetical protein